MTSKIVAAIRKGMAMKMRHPIGEAGNIPKIHVSRFMMAAK
jgi:hypothetical protein